MGMTSKDFSCVWVLRMILGVSLILVFSEGAWGEEAKKERMVLTLPQLIEMAISKSPEIGETQSEVLSSKMDFEQAKAAYYPRVESTAITGPVKDARLPVIVGRRIFDPSPDLSLSTIGVFGRVDFTVAQPLYTFGKLSNRREAAFRGVRTKELKLLEKKNEIAFRVKELYYALIVARAGIESADEASSFFDDARSRIKRLLELGSSNVVEADLYRIDAYRADTLRSRAEAEKGAGVASFALQSLTYLAPDVDFDLAEKTLPTRGERSGDLKAYVEKALARRPELKQVEEALAAQESQIKAVRSDSYPSFFVALEGSLAVAPGRKALHNPYITDEFNRSDVGIVAGLRWNFDFGMEPRIGKEKAEYEKLLNAKASGVLNIPIQVAKSYREIQEWKVALESYEKASVASRRWVVAALSSFDMGVGTADDLLRAIEKYGYNRGKYIEALFNYNLSLAALDYSVGVINVSGVNE